VPHYAELAAPLTGKLSVNREEGKKGSTQRVTWKDDKVRAIQRLKEALLEELMLFQADPDKPFILLADARDRAIGAVLEQKREGALTPHGTVQVPGLLQPQAGEEPTELDAQGKINVCSLKKWAGWIGLQLVFITTNHKSLEDWVHEKMDTAGRRA
jgi:hypothetical protein